MPLPAAEWWKPSVHRVAETQFFVRPKVLDALGQIELTAEARRLVGGHASYLDLWKASQGPEFFDMATLMRLATTVETLLRDYYRERQALPGSGVKTEQGVFQRLMPWSRNTVMDLYRTDLGYDLSDNPLMYRMQCLMLHRHLYAHWSGVLYEEYVEDWHRLTGEDLRNDPALTDYPAQDVCWFRPLGELGAFVSDAHDFFAAFPVDSLR